MMTYIHPQNMMPPRGPDYRSRENCLTLYLSLPLSHKYCPFPGLIGRIDPHICAASTNSVPPQPKYGSLYQVETTIRVCWKMAILRALRISLRIWIRLKRKSEQVDEDGSLILLSSILARRFGILLDRTRIVRGVT